MTSLVVHQSEQGSNVVERPVLLVEYDAQALSAGVDPEIAAKWAYNLPGDGGKNVSVRGVEEGVRLLSSHGEIIRVDQCVMVHQDEREAFFSATASRYVINPETGVEVKLDTQTRGKRVPKWEARANGQGEYFVKAWYELGIVKASRNAALAMMPSNVKSALLKAGLDAQAGGSSAPQRSAPARRNSGAQPSNNAAGGANAMTAFWADARRLGFDSDTVLAKSQQMFNNREPIALTAQERIDLLATLTKEKQGVCTEHEPVYSEDQEPRLICSKCGVELEEQAPAQAPLVS